MPLYDTRSTAGRILHQHGGDSSRPFRYCLEPAKVFECEQATSPYRLQHLLRVTDNGTVAQLNGPLGRFRLRSPLRYACYGPG